jgi:hypothetical protein
MALATSIKKKKRNKEYVQLFFTGSLFYFELKGTTEHEVTG